ncbi:MAG: PilZ domain-containing protein [Verrucomicrobiota bacterium]
MQSRRASPRILYDEAVCLTPADAGARIYGRGLDLGTGGMSLVCTQTCPVGTEARCDLLLPGGPRPVAGKVVRVTPSAGGFELAIAFIDLKPGVTALIDEMVAHATPAAVVDVVTIEAAPPAVPREPAADEATGASGAIRKIAVDPSSGDGIPRLALDGDSGDGPRETTLPYGTAQRVTPLVPTMPLPTSLPPPCGQPLPSVVVEPELEASTETPTPTMIMPPPPPSSSRKTVRTAAVAVPPPPPPEAVRDRRARRPPAGAMRVTAVVARRPSPPAWNWQQPAVVVMAPAPAPVQPRRVSLLDAPLSARSLMLLAPILVLVVALVVQLSR